MTRPDRLREREDEYVSVEASPIDRDSLIRQVEAERDKNDAWIRRQVLVNRRIDVLAKEVLGYEIQPFHLAMQKHFLEDDQSLTLVFRGAGKTTVLTVVGTILFLVENPNVRICIASKTESFAKGILSEIKQHLEGNEKFRRIFGDLVGEKWDETRIVISTRAKADKTPSVMAVGIGGQVTGEHFDVIFGDDLVCEDNARTVHMRDRTKTWYYVTLGPTLEPDGRLHVIGTRYHWADLHGHLRENDMSGVSLVIPCLDEHGRSPWPEKFPPSFFHEKREKMGVILFNSQYLCDTEAMKGEIFMFDWIEEYRVDPEDVPDDVKGYGGIDLAIKTKEVNDRFAIVHIGVTEDKHVYVLGSYTKHLRFTEQTRRILSDWRGGCGGWFAPPDQSTSSLVEFGIETVAYQDAQYQVLGEEDPTIRIRPVQTHKDKRTRAHKLSPYFEQGKVHFVGKHVELENQLVLFPGGNFDDLFDAMDIAVSLAFGKRKRRRRKRTRGRVGVI